MGSLIVRVYAAEHDRELDGLVVCGSVAQNSLVKMGLFLNNAYSVIRGERYRSKSIDKLATGSYNKLHNEVGPCRWLSVNEDNINAYIADEKYLRTAWEAIGDVSLPEKLGISPEAVEAFRNTVLE